MKKKLVLFSQQQQIPQGVLVEIRAWAVFARPQTALRGRAPPPPLYQIYRTLGTISLPVKSGGDIR